MIEIRDLKIGDAKPNIVVSLTGTTEREILAQARQAYISPADIIEWRADHLENWKDDVLVIRILKSIRMCIGSKAFLFTFRTKDEGGNVAVKDDEYMHIVRLAIDSRLIDLVDVECCVSEYRAMELITYAHGHNLPIIGSNHSFATKLLTIGEMEFRIRYMQKLGVDIAKLAVSLDRPREVYKLLAATFDLSEDLDFPITILGLGPSGKYTKVLGELFGSCLTYATLDASSDTEEIDVYKLAGLINGLHEL